MDDYWFTVGALFALALVMQLVAWRRQDGRLGHKAVFVCVIAAVLTLTHLLFLL